MKIHLSLAGSQCFAIACFLLTNIPDETKKSGSFNFSTEVPVVSSRILIVFSSPFDQKDAT